MHDILPLLDRHGFPAIRKRSLTTLQINLTLKCNQSCLHCHVNASPKRTEMMDDETIDYVYQYLETGRLATLDITGGAPELHPRFRDLVQHAYSNDVHIIDRCNLTVLEEPGQEDTAEFLAEHEVEIVASLPCYLQENVDAQRGNGVFETSIGVLKMLNTYGYGKRLPLNLVYNPQGAVLPPGQESLQEQYCKYLGKHYGIAFNDLFVLCNMPINRFGSTLVSNNSFDDYMKLLAGAHQDTNLEQVMCRDLVSIDWQGYAYDCDFNQMLGLKMKTREQKPLHISDLLQMDMADHPVIVRDHCYGCTAGQGSSCGGALQDT